MTIRYSEERTLEVERAKGQFAKKNSNSVVPESRPLGEGEPFNAEKVLGTVATYIGLTEDQVQRLKGCFDVCGIELLPKAKAGEGEQVEMPPLEKNIAKSIEELSSRLEVQLADIVAVRYLVANNVLCGISERERQLLAKMKEHREALAEIERLKAQIEEAQTKHVRFLVSGGPVVMATEYDAMRERAETAEAQLAAISAIDAKQMGEWADHILASWKGKKEVRIDWFDFHIHMHAMQGWWGFVQRLEAQGVGGSVVRRRGNELLHPRNLIRSPLP